MKSLLASLLLAAALASCDTVNSGPVQYSTSAGNVLVTEVKDDGTPGASWTVDGRSIRIDRVTDVLTAPGIPHPLATYRTKPTD